VPVDHATMQRGVGHYRPLLAAAWHRRKRSVWLSGRLDEPSRKVKGQWYALDRAVEKTGQTLALLLTEHRAEAAARRLLPNALRRQGGPEKSTRDGRAATAAASQSDNAAPGPALSMRRGPSLHQIVAQDQRGVQRVRRPRLGCKACAAAQDT
jgi:putative transposase